MSEDPRIERLLESQRDDPPRALSRRDGSAEAVSAGAFVVAALALALAGPGEGAFSLGEATVLVVAYALASRVQFAVGAGYTVPTQLVFVPMLLLLPAPLVPLLVVAGILLGNLPDYLSGRTHSGRALLAPGDAWHALGPAVVLTLAGAQGFAWSHWPVYLLALVAQIGTDAAVSTIREWIAHGVSPRLQPRLLGWIYFVDVALAPIGLLAAVAAAGQPYTFALTLPLLALLAVFARERAARIEGALELSHAYRGTALLLGDVIKESDDYTGNHSKSVVVTSLRVADELGLDAHAKRNVEFAALLHDVGKIAVPPEILHKPGPLNDEEWRVMKLHTVEGDRMLQKVGGVLAEVGTVVRASHEHWDGSGYPDGLAGPEIPIEACVVSCCDAFDAMTTDRVYRPAMPVEKALEELRANAGTQFHPDVVEALVRLIEAEQQQVEERRPAPAVAIGRSLAMG